MLGSSAFLLQASTLDAGMQMLAWFGEKEKSSMVKWLKREMDLNVARYSSQVGIPGDSFAEAFNRTLDLSLLSPLSPKSSTFNLRHAIEPSNRRNLNTGEGRIPSTPLAPYYIPLTLRKHYGAG